jgi:hypothetical protein
MRYCRERRRAHPACTRRPSGENRNHGLSSMMLAFVQTLSRNSPPVTLVGSRQGHPLAWHSAWAAASTSALLRPRDRATPPSSRTAGKSTLIPHSGTASHQYGARTRPSIRPGDLGQSGIGIRVPRAGISRPLELTRQGGWHVSGRRSPPRQTGRPSIHTNPRFRREEDAASRGRASPNPG